MATKKYIILGWTKHGSVLIQRDVDNFDKAVDILYKHIREDYNSGITSYVIFHEVDNMDDISVMDDEDLKMLTLNQEEINVILRTNKINNILNAK